MDSAYLINFTIRVGLRADAALGIATNYRNWRMKDVGAKSAVKIYRPGGSAVAGSNKMDRSIFKLVPWDVWAALTVAALVLILAAFDRSPLLGFVLVGLALWAYIAIPHTPFRHRD